MDLSSLEKRIFKKSLSDLSGEKLLISCLNAYSFNILQKDSLYMSAMLKSNIILPDGIAIVFALRFLTGSRFKKISGHELFYHELEQLNQTKGKCFFLGSSKSTNFLIKKKLQNEYPDISVDTFSPPFKKQFSEEESQEMIDKVNTFSPDVLFVGMTAPKQEKWAAQHFDSLNVKHICCIGAVFDFYAETCKRAPVWMIDMGFEWLHRLINEPKRLWRRYIFGNPQFITLIVKEKYRISGKKKYTLGSVEEVKLFNK